MSVISKVKVKNTEYDILDSNYVHTDNNFTTEEKTKLGTLENYDDTQVKSDITNLQNNKANTSDLSTVATSGSYTDLSDKPTIPDVSNFITKDVDNLTNYYTKTETDNKIPDVSNFITKSVDDLVNYYKKSETYTQTEVNNLIGAISTMNLLVVQELPTQDISTTTIYLVPKTTVETNNVYDEYIYVSNNWEKIGTTDADLTNYIQKSQTSGLIKNDGTIDTTTYQAQLTAGTNITIENNVISASGGSSKLNEEVPVYEIKLTGWDFTVTTYSQSLTSTDRTELKTLLQKIYNAGVKKFALLIYSSTLGNYKTICYQDDTKDMTTKPTSMKFRTRHSYMNVLFDREMNISMSWSGDTLSVSSGTMTTSVAQCTTRYAGTTMQNRTALTTDNTYTYTPTGDYNPATKKYVDDQVGNINTVLATLTTPGGN